MTKPTRREALRTSATEAIVEKAREWITARTLLSVAEQEKEEAAQRASDARVRLRALEGDLMDLLRADNGIQAPLVIRLPASEGVDLEPQVVMVTPAMEFVLVPRVVDGVRR